MALFELTGSEGCSTCGPYVGEVCSDLDDEAKELGIMTCAEVEGAGVFHDRCAHEWAEADALAFQSPGSDYQKAQELQDRVTDELGTWGDLSTNQRNALSVYMSTGYKDINALLVKGGKVYSDIAVIDSAMKPLTQSTVVWRGISKKGVQAMFGEAGTGTKVAASAFQSTSFNRFTAVSFAQSQGSGGALMRITVEKGTKARWMGAVGSPVESELLLQRGVTYTVRRVEELPSGVKIFHVTARGA